MKNKIFLIFLNLFSTLTFAQLKTFTVEYNCVLTLKQKISGNDSIKILINNDTLKKPKDLSMKLPKSINMKIVLMSWATIGNSNESKIIIKNTNSGWKNKEQITLFDSMVFKNKKWIQYKENEVSNLSKSALELTYTNEEKQILGYKCLRVDFLDKADSTKGEFWVTQSLPNTLMPFGGYEPLNGAVLECNYFNTGMSYIATSLTHDYFDIKPLK